MIETLEKPIKKQSLFYRFNPKPSTEDLYIFFVQLSAFYKSGSLLNAFEKMRRQIKNVKLRDAVNSIKYAMENEGIPFSEAMSKEINIFPSFIIQAIKAGEVSGKLDSILKEIGYNLKQEGDVNRRVKSALLPMKFVGGLLIVAVGVIFFYLVPKFQQMFAEFHAELPLISRMVFGTIDVVVTYWYIVLFLLVLLLFGFTWFKKTYPDKVDKIVFKIPVYKDVYFYRLQYRIATMFNLMREAGMGTRTALNHLALVADNAVVKKAMEASADLIENEGYTLAESFEKNNSEGIFDHILLSYINTGEESGTTSELLLEAKVYYQDFLFSKLQDFGSKITPVFMLPMAVCILLLLLSIYIPMFTLSQAIQK